MSNYPEEVSMRFLDEAADTYDCDECGNEVGADEVTQVEGRNLCKGCSTCTCEEVDVDAPGPFGPCTVIPCANCEREEERWEPKTLTDVAVREFGLRPDGGRI